MSNQTFHEPFDKLLFSKGLPANVEAERMILGSVLIDGASFTVLRTALSREDWSTEAHTRIWDAMCHLHEQGDVIDRLIVSNLLIERGHIESVGGIAYLASLDDGLPRLDNIDAYVRIVQNKSMARKVIRACYDTMVRVYTNQDQPEAIASWCESTLHALSAQSAGTGHLRHAADIIEEIGIQRFLAPTVLDPNAVPILWKPLARIVPALLPGKLVTIAARPGKGKSAFASQLCHDSAFKGIGVALFSLEMSSDDILRRIVTGRASIDGHKLTLGRLSEAERHQLQVATSEVANPKIPIWIDDTGCRSLPAIASSLRKVKAAHSIGLVVIDYLQLLSATGRRENRVQEITQISRDLKLLAVEFDVPVVALSQLNRLGATEIPDLHHLRDSGSIEQDSDIVIMLQTDKSSDDDPNMPTIPTKFLVRKQRGGPVGCCELLFHRAFTKFVEPETGHR